MPTPESPLVIFQAKPCARTGRKKTAESNQHEVMGNNCRQSQQIRMELGCLSTMDRDGRTIWIVGAHRGDGQRFVVHADEILTAFLELDAAVEPFSASSFL